MRITMYAQNRGTLWGNRVLVWDSRNANNAALDSSIYNAKLTTEINKAGELSFTVSNTHPYYKNFKKSETVLTVMTDDNIVIFRGRITELEMDIFKQLTVTAIDSLAYLEDSIFMPMNEETKSTPLAMLKRAIDNHNLQVNELENNREGLEHDSEKIFHFDVNPERRDAAGNLDPDYNIPNITESKTFSDNSYQDTFSFINSEIIDQYGGYIRLDYAFKDTQEWPEQRRFRLYVPNSYGEECPQDIRFGDNIIELSKNDVTDDLWTVLIPSGDDKVRLNANPAVDKTVTVRDQSGNPIQIQVLCTGDYMMIRSGIGKYGRIFKAESFSASSSSELMTKALEYISNNYVPELLSFKVKLIDKHWLDENVKRVRLGDLCNVYHEHGQTTPDKLRCTAIDYDLMEPENTEYTFGVPHQTLTKKQDKAKQEAAKQTSRSTASAARGVSYNNSNTESLENEIISVIGDYVTIDGKKALTINTDKFEVNSKKNVGDFIFGIYSQLSGKDLTSAGQLADFGWFDFVKQKKYISDKGLLKDIVVIKNLVAKNFTFETAQGDDLTVDKIVINGAHITGDLVVDPTNALGTNPEFKVSRAGVEYANTFKATPSAFLIHPSRPNPSDQLTDILDHQHVITFEEEMNGETPTGRYKATIGKAQFTHDDPFGYFNIASTEFYKKAVADAKAAAGITIDGNYIKVRPDTLVKSYYVYSVLSNIRWDSSTKKYMYKTQARAINEADIGKDAPVWIKVYENTNEIDFNPEQAVEHGKSLAQSAAGVTISGDTIKYSNSSAVKGYKLFFNHSQTGSTVNWSVEAQNSENTGASKTTVLSDSFTVSGGGGSITIDQERKNVPITDITNNIRTRIFGVDSQGNGTNITINGYYGFRVSAGGNAKLFVFNVRV